MRQAPRGAAPSSAGSPTELEAGAALTAFDLTDHPAKAALTVADDVHLARVARRLSTTVDDLRLRLDEARRADAGHGQKALDRDQEVHRLTSRLRLLQRFGLDVCLGRIVTPDETVYVGRLGLTDDDGTRLLVDWRSPAAEPFFGATHAHPMGLSSRRRYRWTRGRITDFWDEVFDGRYDEAALDDQSAFVASLGASRTTQMRDVLATIQADQDAIVRAGSTGALVVDGGPGTGKTVVALHRTAYLLYADPRLRGNSGGVLFVGPHQPYLAYVADVLPSLGEDGVRSCTLADLVPVAATAEDAPHVAALKDQARLVRAVDAAVRFYEDPPTDAVSISTPWCEVTATAQDWREAFEQRPEGTPHDEAREEVWQELLSILVEREDEWDVPHDQLRAYLARDRELRTTLDRAWPLLDPLDIVGDLWTVPAYLRLAAPWLTADEVDALQRRDPRAWTVQDLPFVDAARLRVGDPRAVQRSRRRTNELAQERERMQDVVDDLVETDDSEMMIMSMFRFHHDVRDALEDVTALPTERRDPLAGPFAHVVVDEAQELTDAQWQVLLQRCPSGSFTIVGDRAQARRGFAEPWTDRLHRVGLDRVEVATLTVNYRTPAEVMEAAEPVIRAAIPDANVPTSVRSTGSPVLQGIAADLERTVDEWLATHEEGVACVIGAPAYPSSSRVRSTSPELSKGLEHDLVVLVDPQRWSAVDQYVAMTRATQQLVVLTSG